MTPERWDRMERLMESILESQTRAEARMDKAEVRMDRAEARMDRAEARLEKTEARAAKTDQRLDSITKLLHQGMRMLARMDLRVAELAQSQKATERMLKALLNDRRNGRNGRQHG